MQQAEQSCCSFNLNAAGHYCLIVLVNWGMTFGFMTTEDRINRWIFSWPQPKKEHPHVCPKHWSVDVSIQQLKNIFNVCEKNQQLIIIYMVALFCKQTLSILFLFHIWNTEIIQSIPIRIKNLSRRYVHHIGPEFYSFDDDIYYIHDSWQVYICLL